MKDIQIFNNPQFGSVRTAGTSENPLFCLSDVCKAVDLSNPSSVKMRLDKDDVQLIDLHALNEGQEIIGNSLATFITESGFYEVILFSNSPKVKPFRRWVTKEVLPSIRKTRQYGISQNGLSLPDFSNPAEAARAWADMYDKAHTLEAKTQEQQLAIEAKDKKIEEDKPKVAFADAVTSSSSCCLIGELAKILAQNGYKIGQNRLFEWLRQHHYLGSKGEYYNMPYQKYIEQGIFKLSQKTFSQGVNMKVGVTTVVTAKGQQYFINKFLSNQPTINFE